MLVTYQQLTQLLLHDPKAERWNPFDLISYINIARNQVAGEGECVRVLATFPTVNAQQKYQFSAINVSGTSGVSSVLAVRMITASGVLLASREWEWFNAYYITSPSSGSPTSWCQYGQGQNGSLLLNPTPSGAISLQADCVCLPVALANDSTAEAIPYPWTDAVPYYSAYMAMLTEGDADGAKRMLDLFEMFVARARSQSTATVLPRQYEGGEGAKLAGATVPIVSPIVFGGASARK